MATLYEMTEQARALYEMLQADEIDEQCFADTLEAMGATDKVENYCKIIKQLKADADMFKAEADRVQAKRKAADNAAARMKEALLAFMAMSGQTTAKAGTFTVSIAETQSVNITDETLIPREYIVEQPVKVDKAGIRQVLKDGGHIDGAELVTNVGVRIR